MSMEVIPSIDLRGGRCVRLYQGDYGKETVFSDDPESVARKWDLPGVARLHVVDLDGAAKGEPCHLPIIKEIVKAVTMPVQVGGGIRNMDAIERLLETGVQRVILGTAAVEDPDLVRRACQRFGESIVVSIDAQSRDKDVETRGISGHVAVSGWQNPTTKLALDMIDDMAGYGVKRFIYTDIRRDGTLTQPNFEAIGELINATRIPISPSGGVAFIDTAHLGELSNATRIPIIASGGVASIDHLKELRKLGAEGAIIGRALYTGDINLDEALAALQ